MIIITDSNLVISALITPNGTNATIFKSKSKLQFIAPDFLLLEVKEHLPKVVELSGLTKNQILLNLETLTQKIKFTNVSEIPNIDIINAYEIVKDIDEEDTFFVALHLFKKHKIWTSDKVLIKGLQAKGYNICITTAELKASLYKK
jgi:predicted nucleic acid-binding protein